MHKVFGLVLVAALFVGSAFSSEPTYVYIPQDVDIQTYPMQIGPMTAKQAADLWLTPKNLDRPTPMRNWHRSQHRFVEEVLATGTTIWVDAHGVPVYKHACGNRIAPLPQVAKAVTPTASAVQGLDLMEHLQRFWNALPWWLAGLLAAILALALLAFTVWLLTLLATTLATLFAALRNPRNLPEDGALTIRGGDREVIGDGDGIIVRWRRAREVRLTDDRIR